MEGNSHFCQIVFRLETLKHSLFQSSSKFPVMRKHFFLKEVNSESSGAQKHHNLFSIYVPQCPIKHM